LYSRTDGDTLARPRYRDPDAADRILKFTPQGRRVSLGELRTLARKDHMSFSTLNEGLKQMEANGLVKRVVDETARRPRIHYEARFSTPRGRVDFQEWIKTRLDYIHAGIALGLQELVKNPQMKASELEDLIRFTQTTVSRTCWIILTEFQKLAAAQRVTGTERLKVSPKEALDLLRHI